MMATGAKIKLDATLEEAIKILEEQVSLFTSEEYKETREQLLRHITVPHKLIEIVMTDFQHWLCGFCSSCNVHYNDVRGKRK